MAIADGFHVDSNGNLWLGSNRETFDATTRSEAPFYVYANGDLVAKSGTFSGDLSAAGGTFSGDISGASGTFTGDLSGADISGGTIDIGSGTFQVDSSGNLTATSATITGAVTATSGSFTGSISSTSGTIGGWTIGSTDLSSGNISIDSTGEISANYSSSTGWKLEADGDAFFNSVDVRIDSATSDTPTTGLTTLDIGSTQIYENNDDLYINTSGTNNFVKIRDRLILTPTSTSASNMQLMFDGPGSDDAMGFWHDTDFPNSSNAELYWTNQSGSGDYNKIAYVTTQDDYFHLGSDAPGIKTDYTGSPTMYFDGPGSPGTDSATFNMAIRPYTIKDKDGEIGSSGQVLSSTGSRIDWIDIPSGSSGYYTSGIQINGLQMQDGYNFDIVGSGNISVSTISNPYRATISTSAAAVGASGGLNGSSSNAARFDHAHDYAASSHGTHIPSGQVAINQGSFTTGTGFMSGSGSVSSGGTISISGTNTRNASIFTQHHYPTVGNQYTLGTTADGLVWRRLYAQQSTYVASDQRLKTEIIDIPYGLDYINSLEPKQYEMARNIGTACNTCSTVLEDDAVQCIVCDENGDTADIVNDYDYTGEPIGKKHFGFLAQDLLSTPPEPNLDIGLVDHNTEHDSYVVAYDEFIAPLVKAIQELSAKNDELESRLAALEG